MLPRRVRRGRAKSSSGHAKDDRDVFVGDLDALHQRSQDITAELPIGVSEPLPDVESELLHPAQQQVHFAERADFVVLTAQRVLELRDPLTQAGDARRKFVLRDEALGIAVDETSEALTQLAQVSGGRLVILP
jgi:hypothetical protein